MFQKILNAKVTPNQLQILFGIKLGVSLPYITKQDTYDLVHAGYLDKIDSRYQLTKFDIIVITVITDYQNITTVQIEKFLQLGGSILFDRTLKTRANGGFRDNVDMLEFFTNIEEQYPEQVILLPKSVIEKLDSKSVNLS